MKKTWLFSLPIILLVLFSSCSLEHLFSNYPAGGSAALPADKINDTLRSFTAPFEYKTLLPVRLKLSVELYESTSGTEGTGSLQSLPPQEAVIIVTLHNNKGNLAYAGRIQPDGVLSTLLQLPAAPEDMTLTLHAEGFEERKVLIQD
ncbi:hypothetical protein KA005_77940, partial [bacterium]|nr:hypothetical protein [bacterium]